MMFGVYAIRDVKTSFLSPTLDTNDGSAIRNFNSSIQRSDGIMLTHASDFTLYRIGDYNADTAELIPIHPIVLIASGSDALIK